MIQAHGENRFHTRPYARADPNSTSTFSAALQAMGVAAVSVDAMKPAALGKVHGYGGGGGGGGGGAGGGQDGWLYPSSPPVKLQQHQGSCDGAYPQLLAGGRGGGPSPPRQNTHDPSGTLTISGLPTTPRLGTAHDPSPAAAASLSGMQAHHLKSPTASQGVTALTTSPTIMPHPTPPRPNLSDAPGSAHPSQGHHGTGEASPMTVTALGTFSSSQNV